MQTLIFQLNNDNKYQSIESKGKTMWLVEFLLEDIKLTSIPFHINWALDPKETILGYGNRIGFKKENLLIFIGCAFSDESDGGPFFEIRIDQFVKLLEEWKKLVKTRTPMITITEEDGIITLKGE